MHRLAVVAIVWALAASAIGILALVEERSGADDERRTTATALERIQRSLNERIDALDKRLESQQGTLDGLEGRVEETEGAGKDAAAAREALTDLRKEVQDLSDKVEE